jgi:hypothetical protein
MGLVLCKENGFAQSVSASDFLTVCHQVHEHFIYAMSILNGHLFTASFSRPRGHHHQCFPIVVAFKSQQMRRIARVW